VILGLIGGPTANVTHDLLLHLLLAEHLTFVCELERGDHDAFDAEFAGDELGWHASAWV
jgi:hypothetical protein